MYKTIPDMLTELPDIGMSWWRYWFAAMRATNREAMEFSDSNLIASQIALQALKENPLNASETFDVFNHFNNLMYRGMNGSAEKLTEYLMDTAREAIDAYLNTFFLREGETIAGFARREAEIMEAVANFSEEVEKIKDEFGFHFSSDKYELVHETDTFLMYRIKPLKEGVKVREDVPPVLLVPPYILGVHILSFLPDEGKSYAHAFANEGIPTYVRVVKDIMTNEKVQTTTPEDDCDQTRELCAKLKEIHGRKVTLNGTCQGGYICLMNILSGTLTDVCDSLITNVAPIDGTLSEALCGVPQVHHDFMTTELANGNKVANGYLLSLGMRFVAIDRETPLVRVLDQVSLHRATEMNPGKTPAALFRWLLKERVHLPLDIATMSSATFQEPIAEDGTLPVELYGKTLNVKDLAKLGVPWYQGYAIKDDLVTPPSAMGANKYLEGTDTVESVAFYGGHVAMLTSPQSKRAPLNGAFVDANGQQARGPVKWQLERAAVAAKAT